jgi:hypothetical protein
MHPPLIAPQASVAAAVLHVFAFGHVLSPAVDFKNCTASDLLREYPLGTGIVLDAARLLGSSNRLALILVPVRTAVLRRLSLDRCLVQAVPAPRGN